MILESMLKGMPIAARSRVEEAIDNISVVLQMRNPKVFASMAPSAVRGLALCLTISASGYRQAQDCGIVLCRHRKHIQNDKH